MPLECEKKILNIDELSEKLIRRGKKKLVHCHGCYDLLHPGHIHHFEFAKKLGDLLLVSLNSDAYFVDKGPGRPLFNERLRALSIAALEIVDFVCIYPGFIPEKIFEKIKPEFYVKGIEYDYRRGNPKIPEEEMLTRHGGQVIYGPEENIYSSTKLINTMASSQTFQSQETFKKTICFDIDGTICEQTRGEYEKTRPFPEAIEVVNRLYDEGFKIIFFTARYMGRNGGDREKTYKQGYELTYSQLKSWGFKFHELHLGKPAHHIMVDDKALFFKPVWNEIYVEIKKKENQDIY